MPKAQVVDAKNVGAWADAVVTKQAPQSRDELLDHEAELTQREHEFQKVLPLRGSG